MNRRRLKCGGKPRHKALLGAGEAAIAAATLAAAGMNVAATLKSASQQAKSVEKSAKIQGQALEQQNINNNNLQQESLAFTRQQNQENRQQQQDIQLTLQQLAGQGNMYDRMEANKMQVKYGGRPKRRKLKSDISYGGDSLPFKITDGGGAIPRQVDQNGYGLYELYGNDHEHYHKSPGGKNKTGVGIKFNDGSVVEGEGNQNTNQGELMYIKRNGFSLPNFNRNKAANGLGTPEVMFISKHSIKGFNPTKAVNAGMHPEEAFAIQENIKDYYGITDDGNQAKCGKRKSIKRFYGGQQLLFDNGNLTQFPNNGTVSTSGGVAYIVNPNNRTKAKYGLGNLPWYFQDNNRKGFILGNTPNNNFWNDHGGAIINAGANVGGAVLGWIGNSIASGHLKRAYDNAANISKSYISKMHGIDLSNIKHEDFDAAHSIAVIRDPKVNINPQLERIRRDANYEKREINRNTLSSAARLNRFASTNNRARQRASEQYAYKSNAEEQIKQQNAQRLTESINANAERDTQARKDYTSHVLALMQYNNDIENSKLASMAQVDSDALAQVGNFKAKSLSSSLNQLGSALISSGAGFANSYDTLRTDRTNFTNTWAGLGNEDRITAAIARYNQTGDDSYIRALLDVYEGQNNNFATSAVNQLNKAKRRSLRFG